jgi:hypothetical protein
MKRVLITAFWVASLMHSPNTLHAQESVEDSAVHPLLRDRFHISAGAFVLDKNFRIAVNNRNAIDQLIDFDEQWGLSSDKTSAAAELRWKFGKKWSLWGQYFNTDDSASAVLEEDISWGDTTLKAGSNVAAGVDLTVARIFLGRIFSAGPRHEFGLGLGAHWLEIGAFVNGDLYVNDEYIGSEERAVKAGAPLPNIGGWYAYAFSPRWLMRARVDWLHVSIQEYSGGLWNASLGVNYHPWENFGITAAYQYFGLDADVDKRDWLGAVDLDYYGPFLAVTANW